ncbi:chromate transporter [Methylocella sp.]|uniref:chromate transporter n=1 Tax=Methylocella sp. TaxID=1978226 RepID=UPI003784832B
MTDRPAPAPARAAPPAAAPSLGKIFAVFFVIGATSFGGGVVAYLRAALVEREGWLDDESFLAALEVAQALPGLNATNMSVIVGERLRGVPGAAAAFAGMTLPGATLLMTLGALYAAHMGNPVVNAALAGIGAAAVGLLAATTLQIGRKQLSGALDVAIALLTLFMVSGLHLSLMIVILTVGPLAVLLRRPRGGA